ncbi:class I SAM-dependent methyltransferase [Nocardia sp. NPDC050413]|uniref:class I SAM-dependent methyltransferase n=1 Tax=Nocardia sp. NPDC050413 TaxID=3155784 RepID=UPI00340C150D
MIDDTVRAAYSDLHELYIEVCGSPAAVDPDDSAFVLRHLTEGPVLDLGCGPGHFTHILTEAGIAAEGLDMVPEFIEHARATYPGIPFEVGSIRAVDAPDESVAGLLSWFSLIHLPPDEIPGVLAELRRILRPGGRLVVGFFTDETAVEPFPHKVTTAYRWPVDTFAEVLTSAGFTELDRLTPHAFDASRPYGALAVTRQASARRASR